MNRLERLEAEYALAKIEARFVEKKVAGQLTREDRDVLRRARESYRLYHRVPAADGAQVAAIGSKTLWGRIMAAVRAD